MADLSRQKSSTRSSRRGANGDRSTQWNEIDRITKKTKNRQVRVPTSPENPLEEPCLPSLATPLESTVNVVQIIVKINLILHNIPVAVHELADEDGLVFNNSEPAVLRRCY
jgi:hypothetical protein